jgi:hypothetical protein
MALRNAFVVIVSCELFTLKSEGSIPSIYGRPQKAPSLPPKIVNLNASGL